MSKSASIAIFSLPAINCPHCCSTVSIIAMIVFAMLNANQSICSCHWGLAGCSQANIRAPGKNEQVLWFLKQLFNQLSHRQAVLCNQRAVQAPVVFLGVLFALNCKLKVCTFNSRWQPHIIKGSIMVVMTTWLCFDLLLGWLTFGLGSC